jgi:peptidoglycan-N-acetylglucosamine deacetylase
MRSSVLLFVASVIALVLAASAGGAVPRPSTHADGADVPAGDPLDVRNVSLTQNADSVALTIQTGHSWTPARLDSHRGRSVCAFLNEGSTEERLCVHGPGASRHGHDRVRLARLTPAGTILTAHLVPAIVSRSAPGTLVVGARLATLGLGPGRLRWRVVARWRGGPACKRRACVDSAPDSGSYGLRLRAVHPNGCVPVGPVFQRFGPPRREVALTFDDGPDQRTPAMLDALEKAHAPGTFFQIGRQIAGREALLRRMLADGDAIGDHTWNHADLVRNPGAATDEISRTAAAIRDATGGYLTCLFRAPYGSVDDALFALVRGLGMTTIGWNVDPRDWSMPGTGTIVARVLRAVTPGAIVILHDGGGPRGQTVAAVPRIVAGLRAGGYRLVTVPQLLGFATTYG